MARNMGDKPLVLVGNNFRVFALSIIRDFEGAGFDVQFCSNAGEFMDALKTRDVKAVITELMLAHGYELSSTQTLDGRETGIAVCEWARSIGVRCPFVFVIDDEEGLERIQKISGKVAMVLKIQTRGVLHGVVFQEIKRMLA